MSNREYYDALKLSKGASPEEIKKAYKRLALVSHPDKNPDRKIAAEEEFKVISEAYSVLSDPSKRALYDQHGKAGLNSPPSQPDFASMFGGLFPGFGGFNQQSPGPMRERDLEISIQVPLILCYTGEKISFIISRKSYCSGCFGYGSSDCKDHACPTCEGKGAITKTIQNGPFLQQMLTTCASCGGSKNSSGYIACVICAGKGSLQEQYSIQLAIPKGSYPGEIITLPEQGAVCSKPGEPIKRVAIIITLQFSDSPPFQRNGVNPHSLDLSMNIAVSLVEALCGFSREITRLDGSTFMFECGEICSPAHQIIIGGEGLRRHTGQVGDLFLTVNVTYPTSIRDHREVWKALHCDTPEYIHRSNSPGLNVQPISH